MSACLVKGDKMRYFSLLLSERMMSVIPVVGLGLAEHLGIRVIRY